MKETYKRLAQQYRVDWHGRRYDRDNPVATDIANQAINHVVTAVEATAMVAVAVTGSIPQLGFIHEGPGRSFTLDITDLFRDTVTLPVAFAAAKDAPNHPDQEIERIARRLAAKTLRQERTVLSMIDRIKELLDDGTSEEAGPEDASPCL
jgi:CRISPR-associated protein Cas1